MNAEPAYIRLKNLHTLAQQRQYDALFEVLHKDESDVVRHEAAFLIGDVAPDAARSVFALSVAALDKSILVRHEAALALAKFTLTPESRAVLFSLMSDDSVEVRDSAKFALEELMDGKF